MPNDGKLYLQSPCAVLLLFSLLCTIGSLWCHRLLSACLPGVTETLHCALHKARGANGDSMTSSPVWRLKEAQSTEPAKQMEGEAEPRLRDT